MEKISRISPLSVAIVIAIVLLLNALVFGAPGAFFQGQPEVMQTIEFITVIITFFMLIGGIVFWVVKVKNYKAMEETNAILEKTISALKEEIAVLEKKVLKRSERIACLEESEEKLKKANLRLQGINDE